MLLFFLLETNATYGKTCNYIIWHSNSALTILRWNPPMSSQVHRCLTRSSDEARRSIPDCVAPGSPVTVPVVVSRWIHFTSSYFLALATRLIFTFSRRFTKYNNGTDETVQFILRRSRRLWLMKSKIEFCANFSNKYLLQSNQFRYFANIFATWWTLTLRKRIRGSRVVCKKSRTADRPRYFWNSSKPCVNETIENGVILSHMMALQYLLQR